MTYISQQDVAELEAVGWSRFRITYLEEYLSIRNTLPILTVEVLERFADGRADFLSTIASMLSCIDPKNSDLPILYAGANTVARKRAPIPKGPGKGRPPVLAVPLGDISQYEHDQITRWKGSDRSIKNMLYTLRQIYGAARRVGTMEVFDRPALAAFRQELDDRDLAANSIVAAMTDCLRLREALGAEQYVTVLISRELNAAVLRAAEEPSVRKDAFRANPVTPIDLARKASEVSGLAYACTAGRQTRHRLFLTAAVLAYLSWMPDRVGDLRTLVVGREIIRTDRGWSIDFLASKTGFEMGTPTLPDELTPYLDDLILLGADPGIGEGILHELYRQRVAMQSPLFARTNLCKAYSGERIFEWIKSETGHGPHAFRKSMADYCAEIGLSVEEAMLMLGHRRRDTTEKYYEVHANITRRAKLQKSLSTLRQTPGETDKGFRTPSGRLVDVAKINKSLSRSVKPTA